MGQKQKWKTLKADGDLNTGSKKIHSFESCLTNERNEWAQNVPSQVESAGLVKMGLEGRELSGTTAKGLAQPTEQNWLWCPGEMHQLLRGPAGHVYPVAPFPGHTESCPAPPQHHDPKRYNCATPRQCTTWVYTACFSFNAQLSHFMPEGMDCLLELESGHTY